jgi:membrane associated rhomboid family serine protease
VVIPIHDTNPVRRTPVVNYAIMLACILVFLVEPVSGLNLSRGGKAASICAQEAFFREYAAVPREVVTNEPLQRPVPTGEIAQDPQTRAVGCVVAPPTYDKMPVLSVLFAMFLHGGWLHLLGNMLFLYVFGNNVEDRFGRLGYLLFYLFCGFAATYVFSFFYADSTETLVGASGAIAGVLGSYLVLFPRARVVTLLPFLFFIPARLPAWFVLGGWFLLQYLYFQGAGLTGGADVAYLAHVAGFVAGLLIALPFRGRSPRRPPPAPAWRYGY